MQKETSVINECEHKPHIMTTNSISAAIIVDALGMDEKSPLRPIALLECCQNLLLRDKVP